MNLFSAAIFGIPEREFFCENRKEFTWIVEKRCPE
jgi:hypothetical protein